MALPMSYFDERVERIPFSGCWVWTAATSDTGYGSISKPSFTKERSAHRAFFETFKGKIPKGMHVLHRCDNRSCVNPEHLFVGSNSDNVWDMLSEGRMPRGEKRANAVFNERAVIEIRGSKEGRDVLAKRYGVSIWTIHHIKYRRRWRGVCQ